MGTQLIPIDGTKYSRAELLNFLDYIADKHLVKVATAQSWKKAAIRFFSIFDDDDPVCLDVRELDIEHTAERIMNDPKSDFKPTTMRVFQSRVRTAIGEFVAYKGDPVSYKPSISQRSSRAKAKARAEKTSEREKQQSLLEAPPAPAEPSSEGAPALEGLCLPIPVREGVVVQVVGVPFDLTQREAAKIGAVVKAMASEDVDG